MGIFILRLVSHLTTWEATKKEHFTHAIQRQVTVQAEVVQRMGNDIYHVFSHLILIFRWTALSILWVTVVGCAYRLDQFGFVTRCNKMLHLIYVGGLENLRLTGSWKSLFAVVEQKLQLSIWINKSFKPLAERGVSTNLGMAEIIAGFSLFFGCMSVGFCGSLLNYCLRFSPHFIGHF